ncbi:MAG: hypothetical protein AB7F59_13555 [Bdellovibrionales bacterium]
MFKTFSRISKKYSTPEKVQRLLLSYKYNQQKPETMQSALKVWQTKAAHCLEATHFAAAVLEHQGYLPLALSMESEDNIGHVVFLFQQKGFWGTVGKSKEIGLQGRRPVFKTIHRLVMSYFDEYVDDTGRMRAYQVLNLDHSQSQWRESLRNVWKSEKYILNLKHKALPPLEKRYQRAYQVYYETGHQPKTGWW